MSKLIPIYADNPDADYAVWLAIFAVIVVPLSMLHLSEQATVQVILSACRIIMMIFMVATPLAAHWWGSGGDVDQGIGPVPHFGQQTEALGAPWIHLGGIHKMFPAIVFSLLFHQAVPGLADEMNNKPKVGKVFEYTFILCGVAYGLLGIVGAFYFGEDVYQSANLNWHNYHGGTGTYIPGVHEDDKMAWINIAPWAQCIRTFVVIFPAIDVVSAYPLYAYTLGNTLLGLLHADNVQELQVRLCKQGVSFLCHVPVSSHRMYLPTPSFFGTARSTNLDFLSRHFFDSTHYWCALRGRIGCHYRLFRTRGFGHCLLLPTLAAHPE